MKPRMYVPDHLEYGFPFQAMFEIVHDANKQYDKDILLSCDFLMLTGGEDIEPAYYEHTPIPETKFYKDNQRDTDEWILAQAAIEADIPIIGVCRGAQWLSILAGGKLIQHVNGHYSGHHAMHTIDPDKKIIPMSSSHHQMCDLREVEHVLIGWTERLSSTYLSEKNINLYPKGLSREPEVFYIPNIRGFGIQGHPEYLHANHIANQFLRDQIADIYNLPKGPVYD